MMSTSNVERFFRALELLPSLAAVRAEWETLVGEEYPHIKGFLRPRNEAALSYPCSRIPPCGCQHAVIKHADDDIVAVCQCNPPDCDTVTLTRQQVIVYEVDIRRLSEAVVEALGLMRSFLKHEVFGRTYQIGSFRPQEGYDFPVVLFLATEPNDLQAAVSGVAARSEGPFILFTPTQELWTPTSWAIVKDRNAGAGTLTELLEMTEHGLAARPAAERLLTDFRLRHLPPPAKDARGVKFPTPPGAVWSNIRMSFPLDDHSVTIKVFGIQEMFHCTDIPTMARKKNRRPTKVWETLLDFAKGKGNLNWKDPYERSMFEKRVERLSHILMEFFQISGNPIKLESHNHRWVAQFQITFR